MIKLFSLVIGLGALTPAASYAAPVPTASSEQTSDIAQTVIFSLLPENYERRICAIVNADMFAEFKSNFESADQQKAGASDYIATAMVDEFQKVCIEDVSRKIKTATIMLSSRATAGELAKFEEFRNSEIGGRFLTNGRAGYEILYFTLRGAAQLDVDRALEEESQKFVASMSKSEKAKLNQTLNISVIRVLATARAALKANGYLLPLENLSQDDVDRITASAQKASDLYLNANPKSKLP